MNNQNNFLAKVFEVYIVESNFSFGNYFYLGVNARNLSMNNNGGLLYVEGEYLNISNTEFSYGFADVGGALYFKPKGIKGVIDLKNVIFNSTTTSINKKSTGIGGAIYIDGKDAVLNFNIKNSRIMNSFARFLGGAFYFATGKYKSNITIQYCNFSNIFSPGASLIYGLFTSNKDGIVIYKHNIYLGTNVVRLNN